MFHVPSQDLDPEISSAVWSADGARCITQFPTTTAVTFPRHGILRRRTQDYRTNLTVRNEWLGAFSTDCRPGDYIPLHINSFTRATMKIMSIHHHALSPKQWLQPPIRISFKTDWYLLWKCDASFHLGFITSIYVNNSKPQLLSQIKGAVSSICDSRWIGYVYFGVDNKHLLRVLRVPGLNRIIVTIYRVARRFTFLWYVSQHVKMTSTVNKAQTFGNEWPDLLWYYKYTT